MQTLYRKYRNYNYGKKFLTDVIKMFYENQILNGKISHAYILREVGGWENHVARLSQNIKLLK